MSELSPKAKEYSNGEVTIVWKADLCIHSANCVNGLPEVFQPNERPWIKVNNADTEALIEQVKQCPSGALSYYLNNQEEKIEDMSVENEQIVEVVPNGPLMVYGNLRVKQDDKEEVREHRVTAFCRCGASTNKPYCDGSHKKIDFKG